MSNLINYDGQTMFKVPVSGSFTVPETLTMSSPTGDTKLDTKRATVGGQLVAAYDDVAGTAVQGKGIVDQISLLPGDIVACSAVVGGPPGVVTVTVTSKSGAVKTVKLTGVTAVAGVIGFYA